MVWVNLGGFYGVERVEFICTDVSRLADIELISGYAEMRT